MYELSTKQKIVIGNTDIEFTMSDEFLSLARKELGLSDSAEVDTTALKTVFLRILKGALTNAV